MRSFFAVAVASFLSVVGTGCSNPCQAICHDMADYAEQCGFTVVDGELDACMDSFSNANLPDGQKDVCREHGGNLEEEWTCQDVGDYFGD